MTFDMREPCKFPSPDSCQKRFQYTHKEVDLAPHPVVDLVSQAGDAEKFLKHLVSKAWIIFFFFRISKQGPCFTAIDEDGGDKRLVQLELACKADGFARQILFGLAIAAIAEAILMRISDEQVPFLQRVAPRYLKLVTSSNFRPFMLLSALMLFRAVNHDLALFCAYFYSICYMCQADTHEGK